MTACDAFFHNRPLSFYFFFSPSCKANGSSLIISRLTFFPPNFSHLEEKREEKMRIRPSGMVKILVPILKNRNYDYYYRILLLQIAVQGGSQMDGPPPKKKRGKMDDMEIDRRFPPSERKREKKQRHI